MIFMLKILSKLNTGEKLIGRIESVLDDHLYIINLKGELLSAYSELEFSSGEQVILEVNCLKNKIVLKLCRQGSEKPVFEREIKLLKACGLSISEKNINLLSVFLKNELNIVQKDYILKYIKDHHSE